MFMHLPSSRLPSHHGNHKKGPKEPQAAQNGAEFAQKSDGFQHCHDWKRCYHTTDTSRYKFVGRSLAELSFQNLLREGKISYFDGELKTISHQLSCKGKRWHRNPIFPYPPSPWGICQSILRICKRKSILKVLIIVMVRIKIVASRKSNQSSIDECCNRTPPFPFLVWLGWPLSKHFQKHFSFSRSSSTRRVGCNWLVMIIWSELGGQYNWHWGWRENNCGQKSE